MTALDITIHATFLDGTFERLAAGDADVDPAGNLLRIQELR